jgi:lipopolysaccharide heptosyltransferase I
MTARKQRPLSEYSASRIALIKPSALGDIIHSLPVLTALRRRYPQAHISWVVNRAYEPLLLGHPDLNETLSFDRGLVRAGMLQAGLTYARFLAAMRRRQFDLVIDLQGLLRSGLMTAATGATRRVGFDSAREGARWFYTDVIAGADRDRVHAVDRYWLVAEAFGVGDAPKIFHVPLSKTAHDWAEAALGECARPWLFLAVGSRWVTKRWPPAHFAVLARQAQQQFGGTVVFVGAADETALARKTAALLSGPSRDLTGQTSLPQLGALLARADVMIANDTGPLHLANALGRPVIAPYTCTSVRLTGPYQAAAGAVETRIWCQGRYLKRCPRLECMAELTPDRLWPPLERVLLQWESTGCRSA